MTKETALIKGDFNKTNKLPYVDVARRWRNANKIQGVILGESFGIMNSKYYRYTCDYRE